MVISLWARRGFLLVVGLGAVDVDGGGAVDGRIGSRVVFLIKVRSV